MQNLNLFYHIQCIQAVEISDDSRSLRNLPMYNNDLKVYKKANTKLAMNVKRFDRKSIVITQDKRYYLNVLSQDSQYTLIRKEFVPEDIDRGRFFITISADEIEPLEVGRYYYSVSYIDENSEEYLLFTNQNAESNATFQVLENALPIVKPPFVQFQFTKVRTRSGPDYPNYVNIKETYISSRLPITHENHTIELLFENFTGKIKVQTTRSPDPNDQVSWEDFEELDFSSENDPLILEYENINAKYFRLQIENYNDEGKLVELRYF